MALSSPFAELIARARSGDADAAAELVRRYEPSIRRVARIRLHHSALRRQFDSTDVCQSVLGSFFVRLALGQYDIGGPEALGRLLGVIARNKVADLARRKRNDGEPVEFDEIAASGASPSRVVAGRDLLERVRAELSDDERRLADLRAAGREWADIAADLGGSEEALRKRLARAIDRVARKLGYEG